MEEYDDVSAGPTEYGALDLSHNTWTIFPPDLNKFSTTLLHLDLKNNNLTQIPESIADLVLLQTLDVSINRIEYIDTNIKKCIRLRSFNVSCNRLSSLPSQLSRCILLNDIVANQNRLESLPESLTDLIAISMIDVRHNQLNTIPLGLCRVPTLKGLLCEGNNDLSVAPENMRGSTDLLFHCLEFQQKLKEVTTAKSNQRDALQSQADEIHDEMNNTSARISKLEEDIAVLIHERPEEYIRWKERVIELSQFVGSKMTSYWRLTKTAFLKWLNEQRTHPEF